MTARNRAAVLKRKLERMMKQLEKIRDELRDIETDAAEYGSEAADALDSIKYATDRLSELQ